MQQSYCIAFLHCIKVYYFVNTTFHFIKWLYMVSLFKR